MSAPPPAILIAHCAKYDCWRATAVVAIDGAPGEILGDSTMEAEHPAAALLALLGRRFGILHDAECAPTVVSIAAATEPTQ